MVVRNFGKDSLGLTEDWYGNNVTVRCPICRKQFIVSQFIASGRRVCPKCCLSTAELTADRLSICWSDTANEVVVMTHDDLMSKNRLDEFVALVGAGGAIEEESIRQGLPSAQSVAFIERDGKMIAAAAVKKPTSHHVETVARQSHYNLPATLPEIGYVVVASDWQGGRLSWLVFDKALELCNECAFATTSEPKIKSLLASRAFRWVGVEWPSSLDQSKLLSLWIRPVGQLRD